MRIHNSSNGDRNLHGLARRLHNESSPKPTTASGLFVSYRRVCWLRNRGRLEPVATADRRHLEMQRCVARVSALIHECLRPLLGLPNLDEPVVAGMLFAKMDAESALAVSQVLHRSTPKAGHMTSRKAETTSIEIGALGTARASAAIFDFFDGSIPHLF